MMRLLVEVESTPREWSQSVDTARAFESNLRDRIAFLETQLDERRVSVGYVELSF